MLLNNDQVWIMKYEVKEMSKDINRSTHPQNQSFDSCEMFLKILKCCLIFNWWNKNSLLFQVS